MVKKIEEYITAIKEGFGYSEIARKRGIKRETVFSAVKKYEKSLIKKPEKIRGGVGKLPFKYSSRYFRVHALQYVLKVSYASARYRKFAGSTVEMDQNLLICYDRKINLYINHEFVGHTQEEAQAKGEDYLFLIIKRLERRIGVYIKRYNIKRVKIHVAEVNNEIAKQVNADHQRITIKSPDGEAWLTIDQSKGIPELETIHPQWGDVDYKRVVTPFMNQIRADPRVLLRHESDIGRHEREIGKLDETLLYFGELIKGIFPSFVNGAGLINETNLRPDYIG